VKLTPRVLEALVMLRGNPHFQIFLQEGLQEHIRSEAQRCVDMDGTLQSRAAGATKALQFWDSSYRDAPAVLEKLRNSNTSKGT
jgi:hypothetical protein